MKFREIVSRMERTIKAQELEIKVLKKENDDLKKKIDDLMSVSESTDVEVIDEPVDGVKVESQSKVRKSRKKDVKVDEGSSEIE